MTALGVSLFVRAREFVLSRSQAQTTAEYALVLVAVALAAFAAYKALGNTVISLASGVDSTVTGA